MSARSTHHLPSLYIAAGSLTSRSQAWVFASIALWACVYALPASASELLRRLSSRPIQAESTMLALEPWETPVEGFFIRTHQDPPPVPLDPDGWVLIVDGLVEQPLKLTVADLKKLPPASLHAVLECAGNGRSRQTPKAPGIQWTRGAAGNAEWGGTSLAAILAMARVKPQARFARVEGADKPAMPTLPGYVRSIPIEKLQQDNTLIAWSMNRQAMSHLHGGPLRLVLPGWYAENWIKWVTHITLSESEDQGYFMKKAYRMPPKPIKPGTPWDSRKGKPIETILVQSLIIAPEDGARIVDRTFEMRGKAFSGSGSITQVDISTDSGKTWRKADLEDPRPSGGWQAFKASITGSEAGGELTLMSRATDSTGHVQPETHTWNPSGYVWNAVDRVTVQLEASPSTPKTPSQADTLIQERCVLCHARELIDGQILTAPQWDHVLGKMQEFGVMLSPQEKQTLIAQLAKAHTTKLPPVATTLSKEEAPLYVRPLNVKLDVEKTRELFATRCSMCHGPDGEGMIGPRLKGRSVVFERFRDTVRLGRNAMPPLEGTLTDQEIAMLWEWLQRILPPAFHERCGNQNPCPSAPTGTLEPSDAQGACGASHSGTCARDR